MDNESLKKLGEGAGIAAAVAYALSSIFAKRTMAVSEVRREAEAEADRLIGMLKEQRDTLEVKVDELIDSNQLLAKKMDALTELFMRFSCPNAPDCGNRPHDAGRELESIAVS